MTNLWKLYYVLALSAKFSLHPYITASNPTITLGQNGTRAGITGKTSVTLTQLLILQIANSSIPIVIDPATIMLYLRYPRNKNNDIDLDIMTTHNFSMTTRLK